MFTRSTVDRISSEYKQELDTYDIKKMIKILEKAIDVPVSEESLEGIQRKYNYCISKLFDNSDGLSDDDREIVAENFFRIEPLLKKIMYIANRTRYNELKQNRGLECGSLLDHLHILESLRTNRGYLDLSRLPDNLIDSNSQEDHIFRTYKLRNVSAHEMRNWSKLALYTNIQDVMITALYVCWKYKTVIEEAYEQNDINAQIDVSGYVLRIIDKYEASLKKGFVFVPINWTYIPNVTKNDPLEQEMDITQLLLQAKSNSHILLLGGAGCGKTTSIEYLEYNNALSWKKSNTSPIPVKICLSETKENWISLEEAICDELRIPYEICEKLLSRGGVNLYLDGVNEMVSSKEIKTNIVRQIEKFLKEYKNVFVMISDRENVEIRINADLMTFYLHQMGEEDIKKYVNSKRLTNEHKNMLVEYAITMTTEGVKFTPIILNYLTEYLQKTNKFPEDSTELYVHYISYLLEREYNEKKDIIAAPGRLDALLKYLAVRMDDNELNNLSTMRVFSQCINYLGMINMDTKNCLDLAIQLGILEQDGDIIHFANEEFYYSLLAKGIELGMDEWNID